MTTLFLRILGGRLCHLDLATLDYSLYIRVWFLACCTVLRSSQSSQRNRYRRDRRINTYENNGRVMVGWDFWPRWSLDNQNLTWFISALVIRTFVLNVLDDCHVFGCWENGFWNDLVPIRRNPTWQRVHLKITCATSSSEMKHPRIFLFRGDLNNTMKVCKLIREDLKPSLDVQTIRLRKDIVRNFDPDSSSSIFGASKQTSKLRFWTSWINLHTFITHKTMYTWSEGNSFSHVGGRCRTPCSASFVDKRSPARNPTLVMVA